jgi:hypothetical protein
MPANRFTSARQGLVGPPEWAMFVALSKPPRMVPKMAPALFTRRQILTLLSAAVLVGPRAGLAANREPMVFSKGGVAINGYDPVAYFTIGKPVRGKARYSLIWKQAEWQFASAANLALFEADPRAFAPQFGGYCAYAMSQGHIEATQPDAWRIHGGKLYLIEDRDVRGVWARDIPGNVVRANANWPAALKH